jgi:hypothetical protein
MATLALSALLLVYVVCVFRPLQRRMVNADRPSIRRGLFAAAIAAVSIIVLTYGCAWDMYRPFVAIAHIKIEIAYVTAFNTRTLLRDYVAQKGHYPDTLEKALPPDENIGRYVDPWGNRYHYSKTDSGYCLTSLGRDGKPGGVGLASDVDISQISDGKMPFTFFQFLFEGQRSSVVFGIALWACLPAALTCFLIAVSPTQIPATSFIRALVAVLLTIPVVLIVVFNLLDVSLVLRPLQ